MNPAVSCIYPSILNVSTVELQFYQFSKGRGRQFQVSRAVLPAEYSFYVAARLSRLSKHHPVPPSTLHGKTLLRALEASSRASKHSTQQNLLQASLAQFPVSPSILHGRIFILFSQRYPAVPCGVPVLQ